MEGGIKDRAKDLKLSHTQKKGARNRRGGSHRTAQAPLLNQFAPWLQVNSCGDSEDEELVYRKR